MAIPRVIKKTLGQLLIERSLITQEKLTIALEAQSKDGGYLSQHLIALGFVTELDIATCLSNQYGFAYLCLKNYDIPQELLELFPLKWIKIYTFLPVNRVGNVLSVAMADPLNDGVIHMLQQLCNCEIVVFISTYSELTEAINRYFGEELKDLKKHSIEPEDLEEVRTTVDQFIQTKAYAGLERRRYVRVKKELDVSFFYQGITSQGKTKDISYGGVAFITEAGNYGGVSFSSNIFTPLNTSLACKINLKPNHPSIDVVINVLRVQAVKGDLGAQPQGGSEQKYEIAGMFEFIANDDREALLSFLKEKVI